MEPLPFNLWIEQARHLLDSPPGAEAWQALLAFAARCPAEHLGVGLGYLDHHLAGWPDLLRLPAPAWRELLLTAEALPPAFCLVRNLQLQELRLSGNPARLLAQRPELRQLRVLAFRRCPLGSRGVSLLAPALEPLHTLDLCACQVGADGAAALAAAPLWSLRRLALDDNLLGPDGVAALLGAPWISRVQHLSLRGDLLNHAAAEHLALADLPALQTLDLSGNQLNDDALLALLGAPWMPQLEALSLDWNLISDRGAARLCAVAPELHALRALSLDFNAITQDDLQRLRDAPWPQPGFGLSAAERRVWTNQP